MNFRQERTTAHKPKHNQQKNTEPYNYCIKAEEEHFSKQKRVHLPVHPSLL